MAKKGSKQKRYSTDETAPDINLALGERWNGFAVTERVAERIYGTALP